MTKKELEDKVKDLELRIEVLEYDQKDMIYTLPSTSYTVADGYATYPYCQE